MTWENNYSKVNSSLSNYKIKYLPWRRKFTMSKMINSGKIQTIFISSMVLNPGQTPSPVMATREDLSHKNPKTLKTLPNAWQTPWTLPNNKKVSSTTSNTSEPNHKYYTTPITLIINKSKHTFLNSNNNSPNANQPSSKHNPILLKEKRSSF